MEFIMQVGCLDKLLKFPFLKKAGQENIAKISRQSFGLSFPYFSEKKRFNYSGCNSNILECCLEKEYINTLIFLCEKKGCVPPEKPSTRSMCVSF